MGGPGIEILWSIFPVHSASQLQSAGISAQGVEGCLFVARPEHDNVPTVQSVPPIQLCEPCGRLFRNKIRSQFLRIEAPADDLFHATFVQVNTWPKHAGKR